IPNEEWDALSLEKRCRICIEWERLRQEALLPLLARQKAVYHPFYSKNATDRVVKEPAHVILLDGIYSSQWLPEYVHLNVLVDVSADVRYKRHNLREGTEDKEWHLRWDPVEDYYFSKLRLPETFDVV